MKIKPGKRKYVTNTKSLKYDTEISFTKHQNMNKQKIKEKGTKNEEKTENQKI